MKNITELLLSSNLGIYLPQAFAEKFNPENSYWVYSDEDMQILLEGPENELYWEAWQDVVDNAKYVNPDTQETEFFLSEYEGDLFAIKAGYSINEFGVIIDLNGKEITF